MMHCIRLLTELSKAEVNAGAPGRSHRLSNLLGWNSGVPDGLHLFSNPVGWIVHLRSNLLEWL
jgi:hypothetical protein